VEIIVTVQVLFWSTIPVRRIPFDNVCCFHIGSTTKTAKAAVTGSRQGRHPVSGMIDDLETLAHRVSALTAALADRDAVIAGLRALVAELHTTVAVQAARIADAPAEGPAARKVLSGQNRGDLREGGRALQSAADLSLYHGDLSL